MNSCNKCSNAEPVFDALGHKLNCGIYCEHFNLLVDETNWVEECHNCGDFNPQDWEIL